jgi:hypothetical protein
MRSSQVQARTWQNAEKKKQELIQAHGRGLITGVKQAAKVAKGMIESGWTDMAKFEAEVWNRVRTGKK